MSDKANNDSANSERPIRHETNIRLEFPSSSGLMTVSSYAPHRYMPKGVSITVGLQGVFISMQISPSEANELIKALEESKNFAAFGNIKGVVEGVRAP